MEKLKRIVVAVLLMTLSMCIFAGCAKKRGPYDVKKVTYVIYGGDINHDEVFVITSDYKVTQYSVDPEADRRYDYLKGDFPSAYGKNFFRASASSKLDICFQYLPEWGIVPIISTISNAERILP